MKVAGDTRLKMITFLALKSLFRIISRKRRFWLWRSLFWFEINFLFLPTSSRISLSFQSLRVAVDYIEGNQTAEPIIMVVFPLLSLKKGQVNYLNSKGIKAASIGKGKLCKWRLEVVSFISIRATWYSRSHFIKRYFSWSVLPYYHLRSKLTWVWGQTSLTNSLIINIK